MDFWTAPEPYMRGFKSRLSVRTPKCMKRIVEQANTPKSGICPAKGPVDPNRREGCSTENVAILNCYCYAHFSPNFRTAHSAAHLGKISFLQTCKSLKQWRVRKEWNYRSDN